VRHLEENAAAADIGLTDEQLRALDEAFPPRCCGRRALPGGGDGHRRALRVEAEPPTIRLGTTGGRRTAAKAERGPDRRLLFRDWLRVVDKGRERYAATRIAQQPHGGVIARRCDTSGPRCL